MADDFQNAFPLGKYSRKYSAEDCSILLTGVHVPEITTSYSSPPREHVSLSYSFLRDVTFRASNESHIRRLRGVIALRFTIAIGIIGTIIDERAPWRNASRVSIHRELSARTSAPRLPSIIVNSSSPFFSRFFKIEEFPFTYSPYSPYI